MEDKKKCFDPVVWARQCFYLIFVAIALVFLGFIGLSLIVLFAISLGGIASFIGLLITKERTKKSYIYSTISITASILIFYIFAMGFVKCKNDTMEMICHNTLGYLNKQILQAHEANDKTFSKENWCDYIKKTLEYEYDSMFKCYGDKIGPCSYAMNENIPADVNELPDDLVLLFESAPGWNTIGGMDDVITDRHRKPGANIAFADGHVEFVRPEDLPNLCWIMEN